MNYEEIIEAIRQAGGGPSRGTAACAAQATPQTLAERLIRGEARCILQELPAETVTRVSERTTPLLAPTAVGSTTITAATWPPGASRSLLTRDLFPAEETLHTREMPGPRLGHGSRVELKVPLGAGEVLGSRFEKSL